MTYKTDYFAEQFLDWLYKSDTTLWSQPASGLVDPGTEATSSLAVALMSDISTPTEVASGIGYTRVGIIRSGAGAHFLTAAGTPAKTITNDGADFSFGTATALYTVRGVGIYHHATQAVTHGAGTLIALAALGGGASSLTVNIGDTPVINTSKLTIIEG